MPVVWRLVALASIALAGCGGSAKGPAATAFTEGTRLKAVYYEADGAPPLFLRWYDTVLHTECKFADVGLPDRMVCFPTGNEVFFAQPAPGSADSDPLVSVFDPGGGYFYARSPKRGDPCGTPVHLFSVEMELAAQGLHRLGPEIPLETLVTGTYQPGAGPGRIVPLTIVASDGSVQGSGTRGWFLGGLGAEVYPGVFTEQVAWDTQRQEMISAWSPGLDVASRWHPIAQDFGGFADAACSVRVATGPACPVRARSAFSLKTPTNPDAFDSASYFELDAPGPVGAAVYYPDPDHGCAPDPGPAALGIDPMLAAFPLGAPIPATAFAEAQEVRTGAKQLQVIHAGTADGPASLVDLGARFFDTAHEQRCLASPDRLAADGTVRCLPEPGRDVSQSSFWADADCSVPLVNVGAGGCDPKAVSGRSEDVPTTDAGTGPTVPRLHFRSVGERHQGPLYSGSSSGCAPADTAEPAAQGTFCLIGPEIPPGDFAPVRYVHPD